MAQKQSTIESKSLYFGAAISAIAIFISLVWFGGRVVPLFGQQSIGSVASFLAACAAFLAFCLSYRPKRNRALSFYQRGRRLITDGALAMTYAAICLLFVVVTFYLAQSAFVGVRLDHITSAAMAGLTAGVAGYGSFLAAARMTSQRLSATLTLFMVSGAMASMISAPNPYWWQIHFSSLGGGRSASSVAFNLTLIIGGLVIVGLADMVGTDLATWKKVSGKNGAIKVRIIRGSMATIGVLLAFVGIFPYDTNLTLHNVSATIMTLVFYAMDLALPWLAPGFPKAFYIFSYGMFAALFACNWLLVKVHYLNLTTFELLTAGIIFTWLVVFVRYIGAGLMDAGVRAA